MTDTLTALTDIATQYGIKVDFEKWHSTFPVLPVYRVSTLPGHNLNVRTSPSLDAPVKESLPSGTRVNVLDDTSSTDWAFIQHAGGTGWVYKDYLTRVQ